MRLPWSRKPGPLRVGLVGFFGWGNYGDELFVDAFTEHLGDALDLRVLPQRTKAPYYGRSTRAAARSVDAIIIGGGDLVVPWNLSPLYWSRELLDRPVYIHGVGVAQLVSKQPDPEVVKALRAFFQHPNVRHVNARDAISAEWIEKHLQPRVPVQCSPDIVCALTLPRAEPTEDIVGIVTRFRPGNDDDYSVVAEAARRLQERGMRIRHIVLATRETRVRDLEQAAALDVPGKEIVTSESLDELSRAIGECRMLMSMKFHGTVVAVMQGVPSISLMPTAKSVRFLRGIGRGELVSHFAKPELLDLVDTVPDRIDSAVIEQLRADSTSALRELRDKILAG